MPHVTHPHCLCSLCHSDKWLCLYIKDLVLTPVAMCLYQWPCLNTNYGFVYTPNSLSLHRWPCLYTNGRVFTPMASCPQCALCYLTCCLDMSCDNDPRSVTVLSVSTSRQHHSMLLSVSTLHLLNISFTHCMFCCPHLKCSLPVIFVQERKEKVRRTQMGWDAEYLVRPQLPRLIHPLLHPTAPSCTLLRPATSSCTLLHTPAPSYTLLHPPAPSCTLLHPPAPSRPPAHSCTLLHTPAPSCTLLHPPAPSRPPAPSYTLLHPPTHSCTLLHTPAPSYTLLHPPAPSYTLLHPPAPSRPPAPSLHVLVAQVEQCFL